jgi:hypothetical protein
MALVPPNGTLNLFLTFSFGLGRDFSVALQPKSNFTLLPMQVRPGFSACLTTHYLGQLDGLGGSSAPLHSRVKGQWVAQDFASTTGIRDSSQIPTNYLTNNIVWFIHLYCFFIHTIKSSYFKFLVVLCLQKLKVCNYQTDVFAGSTIHSPLYVTSPIIF